MAVSRTVPSSTSIHRNLTANRLRRHDVSQVRCLWWWGKQSRAWWASQQDDSEERLRRHQALMMHRYTKAMRRRSLWDRDTTPLYPSWRCSVSRMEREMSSTDPMRARVEDRQPEKMTEKQLWHEVHKDFESFKRVVDRAIERDPIGTLFGRRLRSPDTSNNSSWTSWSWIFDPKEIKQDPVPEPPKKSETPPRNSTTITSHETSASQPSVSHSSSSSKTSTAIKSSHSITFKDRTSMTTEYVYDPISGRKVLQTSTSSVAISPIFKDSKALEPKRELPNTGLIGSLFTEHGTSIPVKVYKPPKVSGFTGEVKPRSSPNPPSAPSMGSSRKRELNDLRWRTMGNNIDSSNFNCEPWNNKEPDTPSIDIDEPVEKRVRTSLAPSEDTPLFSGTTYESKSDALTTSDPKLPNDSFRARQGMTLPSLKLGQLTPTRSSEPVEKIEPAMNRPNTISVKKPAPEKIESRLRAILAERRAEKGTRLEPALDRSTKSMARPDTVGSSVGSTSVPHINDATEQQDKREDIDLLRASDIRANTKATRVTKQATEEKKQQARTSLEHQFEQNAVSDKANLESVWKHVKQYPNGIVAKTMQSLGLADSQGVATSSPIPTPRFSEPTTRPGVIRDRVMENHTQVFEPQVADIVDRAKSVKRNLHGAALTIGGVVNERAITAMANRDLVLRDTKPVQVVSMGSPAQSAMPVESAAKVSTTESIPIQKLSFNDSTFVVLHSAPGSGQVQTLPMNELGPEHSSFPAEFSAMATLGALSDPNIFVRHFAELDKHGYDLMSGSRDFLVFRKKATPATMRSPPASTRVTIAAHEAASQPQPQAMSRAKVESLKAAEVLDRIPTSIPTPGPAAPTAPPASHPFTRPSQKPETTPALTATQSTKYVPIEPKLSTSQPDPQEKSKPRKSRSRISRQEEVFSGQQRLKPQTTALPDPEHFQKQTPSTTQQDTDQQREEQYDSTPRLGFFARIRRAIRRTVLTALAFGGGAYAIGVVAEGLQVRAQIAHGDEGGPMKRVVFDGEAKKIGDRQRVGIFSTESSR